MGLDEGALLKRTRLPRWRAPARSSELVTDVDGELETCLQGHDSSAGYEKYPAVYSQPLDRRKDRSTLREPLAEAGEVQSACWMEYCMFLSPGLHSEYRGVSGAIHTLPQNTAICQLLGHLSKLTPEGLLEKNDGRAC